MYSCLSRPGVESRFATVVFPWCSTSCELFHKASIVVVSPLKALMMDQVQTFSTKGVKAAYLGVEDIEGSTGDQVEKGEISLVFTSPESMITGCRWREMFRSAVYQENLVAVVVDEAHCVDKW